MVEVTKKQHKHVRLWLNDLPRIRLRPQHKNPVWSPELSKKCSTYFSRSGYTCASDCLTERTEQRFFKENQPLKRCVQGPIDINDVSRADGLAVNRRKGVIFIFCGDISPLKFSNHF
jgi:hypothetical protein